LRQPFYICNSRTGWFYRYEAYLVFLGIFVLALNLREYLPGKLSIRFQKDLIPKYVAMLLLLLLALLPLIGRGLLSLIETPQATTNIYEQQYQMGLFLKKFYQGETVAANDIGAINYLANIDSVDLCGLANIKVAKLKKEGSYDKMQIYNLAKGKNVKIAIVYDHWFDEEIGGMPSQWTKIGQWKILNNVVCGGNIVSFYAIDPTEVENLVENLRAFSSNLPKNVLQSGEYTK